MRKHPLVTLSACGFLTIGGIAAALNSGTAAGLLSNKLSDANSSLHEGNDVATSTHSDYRLDGLYIDRRHRVPRPVAGSIPTSQDAIRQLSAVLYRHDVMRAAAARRAAQLARRREQAKLAAAAAAAAAQAAQAAQAAAAQQAALAAKAAPPPAPKPAPPPPPKPAPKPAPSSAPAGGVWYELRMCESNDDYSIDTGNGYYGAYQFALSTWYALGYTGLPSDAPPAVQDAAAQKLQAESGWGQWPACSAELGL
jgi:hypothetical protein